MHALCRFFLDQSGPGHQNGVHTMLPFLVNMARLYELFVAEWLKGHLPAGWSIKTQEIITIGQASEIKFNIDLAHYDGSNNTPCCVLEYINLKYSSYCLIQFNFTFSQAYLLLLAVKITSQPNS
jgi:5-methylcytosine-specific restriction enzyme subunit McrC